MTENINKAQAQPDGIITWAQLMQERGFDDAELERRVKAGKLPKPFIYDGKRCFMRAEIETSLKEGRAVRYAVTNR